MQINGLFIVDEQGSHHAARFVGNGHEAVGFDGEALRSGIGINGDSSRFAFADAHVAAVVIKLDALPFLGGFEGFDAVAGHHDVNMVVDVGKGIVPKEEMFGSSSLTTIR